ncbi:MAG: hypothetical protein INQ03_25840 [Candidatus Heimdallarchaeota archaeon]|nr:hypothetical protein [Candidatus Heimdallarchaeota archaeon]
MIEGDPDDVFAERIITEIIPFYGIIPFVIAESEHDFIYSESVYFFRGE